jgi:3-isopropylmalate/(R)-2-methylmalate dehydratase small subunit
MDEIHLVEGRAAAIAIDNLDTDQIMPKQFLRGIDKNGLARGVFHDLRFDVTGQERPGFVLNQTGSAAVRILLGGANFGCGSSREHAVWGIQQYGIQAVIAPSFGEIFYSNAMQNRLLLVVLPENDVGRLMADVQDPFTVKVQIDIERMRVRSATVEVPFTMTERHRRMFLEGLDVIGLSLTYRAEVEAFAAAHANRYPWLKDVAASTRSRLDLLRREKPGAP